jgi:hypothetical protein
MNIRKKVIVFLSILFLGTGVLIGCEGGEDQGAVPPGQESAPPGAPSQGAAPPAQPQDQTTVTQPQDQSREQATAEQTPQQPEASSSQQQAEQGSAGAGGTMAQSGAQEQQAGQDQAGEKWVGKQVVSSDDQEIGTVSALHDSGYVMIKGEGDKLHPVPANLLKEDNQGDRLRASFDRNTFQQAPSFSEAEQQQLSGDQLEQVRGYYENKAQGGQQMQGQSQTQSQGQDSQYQQSQQPKSGAETQKQGS